MARRGAGTPFLRQLSLLLLLHLGGTLGCASVTVSPPIVPLGSAVTASCTVQRELCQGLEQGRVRISWMLDNKPVAGSQRQGPGGTEVSNLTLPRFNHTQARLFCCVEWNGTKQRVGMAEIRAGYPPAKPLNLSCVLNLDDYGLTCQWQQGTNSHLPTSFVLKCMGSRAQAVTGCTPRGGHSHCTVPRRLLQLYRQMEIWVSATNALGTAESEHLLIDPMDVAKLDPPTLQSIQSIPFQTDCIPLSGLRAVPGDERSLWVHWEAPLAPVTAYVLEWQRVAAEPGHCSGCWQMERDGAATTALIQDGIEPFQRYNISVYPLYEGTVGVPVHTTAYSQQKAPSHAPKLHLKRISKSEAELCWEPLPVEVQNGFITSYTIFWASSITSMASATVNPSLSSFAIRGLKPSTLYKVHIMASTAAGSTNGTSLILVTTVLDDSELQFLFLSLGLVFVGLMVLLICFQKNERMKEQLWPSVPDPANSSLGKWVPAALPQVRPFAAPSVPTKHMVFQEKQKLQAAERLKKRREWQARARAAREQQKQVQEKQAQEGTPV
nr:granulocyte colony-stimulating factor receptor [Zonotrichia albicollis]